MDDVIRRQDAIEVVHKAIFKFFDVCDDDEESPMTYLDEKLLEVNKAITTRIKNMPPAQPKITVDGYADGFADGYKQGKKDAQPERKTGRWIFDYNNTYKRCRAKCSACGKYSGIGGIKSNQLKDFCPNCGSQMEVEG